MPKVRAPRQAVEYAKSHRQFSFGVHLTYVSDGIERPVSDPKELPALCRPDGIFLPSQTVRVRAMQDKLPIDQIERETSAQISLLRDMGLPISHADSHGHLHEFGPFIRALKNVLPRFGIRRVRTAQDVYPRRPLKSPTFWYGFAWRRRIKSNFVTTDHLFMPTNPDDARQITALLPKLIEKNETIEVGVHPGYTEDWRVAEGNAAKTFFPAAREAGHTLITWNDV